MPKNLALFTALASVCLLHLSSGQVRAQTAAPTTIPPEVNALFDDVDDVNNLRYLNPLTLKPDQLTKIVDAIQAVRVTYYAALAAAAVPPIRKLAEEIKAVKQKMLLGGTIPKDFDDKVKALQADYIKRRDQADFDALKDLSAKIRAIVTDDQFATAAKLAKDFYKTEGKPTTGIADDRFFNYYVMQIFVRYPRIIPLLNDMRAAKSAPVPAAAH